MKQKVWIVVGAVTILILIIVWAYLMFFGTPKNANDVFTELGLSGEEDTSFVAAPEIVTEEEATVNMERSKLRQLTTREVAGYIEVDNGTSTNEVILNYAEAGTGHIYSINIITGEEERISGTTIAQANKAVFSPNGQYVAISKNSNTKESTLVLGKMSSGAGLVLSSFSEPVHDFNIGNNSELLYSKYSNQNLAGYSANLASGVAKSIFTIPFYDAAIIWGINSTSTHYVYPRSSNSLEGYLYEVRGNNFTRLPIDGFGLTANANEDMIIYTKTGQSSTEGYVYNREEERSFSLQSAVIPEKCLIPPTGFEILCAQEPKVANRNFIDSWHKGTLGAKDSLWILSTDTVTAELLVDTFAESGRELDIINLGIGDSKTTIYFINKSDNSLWMYAL